MNLPLPKLTRSDKRGLSFFTDEALFDKTKIRIAFFGKEGGVSENEFEYLNLGNHVGDEPLKVEKNRQLALGAMCEASSVSSSDYKIINPKQVHKDKLLEIYNSDDVLKFSQTEIEADGVLCSSKVKGVCPLLCFADCVPVIMATENGAFAVVHAGWRGIVNKISQKAFLKLLEISDCKADEVNAYVGAHLRQCCFEVGEEPEKQFEDVFGRGVIEDKIYDKPHISMIDALIQQLRDVGVTKDRISDLGICTNCSPESEELFYSYRKTNGHCGRHGSMAFKA